MTLLLGPFDWRADWRYKGAVKYRQDVPYAARYLIALVAWAAVVMVDLATRILMVPALPFVMIGTAFGLAYTQDSAQLTANLGDFFTKPFMRMPRWRKRGHGATAAALPPMPAP